MAKRIFVRPLGQAGARIPEELLASAEIVTGALRGTAG